MLRPWPSARRPTLRATPRNPCCSTSGPPRCSTAAFALAFPFVRRPLSVDAVNATAVQNAGVGLVVFIPGADLPIMTLNQAKMLLQIAAAYGEPLGKERVKELAAVVGGAFACRSVARQIVAFVPALGWAV